MSIKFPKIERSRTNRLGREFVSRSRKPKSSGGPMYSLSTKSSSHRSKKSSRTSQHHPNRVILPKRPLSSHNNLYESTFSPKIKKSIKPIKRKSKASISSKSSKSSKKDKIIIKDPILKDFLYDSDEEYMNFDSDENLEISNFSDSLKIVEGGEDIEIDSEIDDVDSSNSIHMEFLDDVNMDMSGVDTLLKKFETSYDSEFLSKDLEKYVKSNLEFEVNPFDVQEEDIMREIEIRKQKSKNYGIDKKRVVSDNLQSSSNSEKEIIKFEKDDDNKDGENSITIDSPKIPKTFVTEVNTPKKSNVNSEFIIPKPEEIIIKGMTLEEYELQRKREIEELENYLEETRNLKDTETGENLVNFPKNYGKIVNMLVQNPKMSNEQLQEYLDCSEEKHEKINPYEPISKKKFKSSSGERDLELIKIKKLDLILEDLESKIQKNERNSNFHSSNYSNYSKKKK